MTSQLTAEHHTKRPFRIRLPFITLACIGLVLAGWLYQKKHQNHPVLLPVPGNDPCDLVLIGVRPDYGDELYSPDGSFLRLDPCSDIQRPFWNADRLQRDFVFEIPVPEDTLKILKSTRLYLNGYSGYPLYPKIKLMRRPTSTRVTLCIGLPRLSMNSPSVISQLRGGEPVRTVDIEVRFFAGERHLSPIHFTGPFQSHQTYLDDEGLGYHMNLRQERIGSRSHHILLELSADPNRPLETPIILYRPDGSWKIARPYNSFNLPDKVTHQYRFIDSGLEQLSQISVNEPYYVRTFRNVVIHYPQRPSNTHAPFLDKLAQIFDLSAKNIPALKNLLAQDQWTGLDRIVQFLPHARGAALLIAIRSLSTNYTIDQLTPSQCDSLRHVLQSWLGTELEPQALAIGNWAQWPEFISAGLERLPWSHMPRKSEWDWARSFSFRKETTAREIEQVADFLKNSYTHHSDSRRYLIQFLRSQVHHPAGRAALLDLAQCDRPWVWTHLLQDDHLFAQMVADGNIPDLIWQRALALDVTDSMPVSAGSPAAAYAPIATWLSPAFAQYDPNQFTRVVMALDRHGDPQRDTPILGHYLRDQLEQWSLFKLKYRRKLKTENYIAIQKVVMLLNQWHQLHLGALGNDLDKFCDRENHHWRDIARMAIDWIETRQDPMWLAPDATIEPNDLRIVWYQPNAPEESTLLLWSCPPRPSERFDFFVWSHQAEPHQCWIYQDNNSSDVFKLRLRGPQYLPTTLRIDFNINQLPEPTHIHEFYDTALQKSSSNKMEAEDVYCLYWEQALSEDSVLTGTQLFTQWQHTVLHPNDVTKARPRVFSLDRMTKKMSEPLTQN